MDAGGGEGEMHGNSNMETYIKIDSQWNCCMAWEIQTGLCMKLEGQDGGGR